MATNIPLTGQFRVTCEYGRKGSWKAGYHTGIDLVGKDTIYATCNGKVTRIGFDNSYGNFIVIKNDEDGRFHWFCHLSKILVANDTRVSRITKIGIMGSTGKSSGKHLHFEIRNVGNKYGNQINPADYMGIPNKVGTYNSSNYQIKEVVKPQVQEPVLKKLIKNTNLRNKPTTKGSTAVTYLKNTTLYVLEAGVSTADGYVWDKVKIRTNGKEGYMINKNYK